MNNKCVLYRHLKPCGEVFYIGTSKLTEKEVIQIRAKFIPRKYTTLRAQLSNQSKNKTNYKMLEEGGNY